MIHIFAVGLDGREHEGVLRRSGVETLAAVVSPSVPIVVRYSGSRAQALDLVERLKAKGYAYVKAIRCKRLPANAVRRQTATKPAGPAPATADLFPEEGHGEADR